MDKMDRETKLQIIKALKSMILGADIVQVDMNSDFIAVFDQYTGEQRYAPTGRVDISLDLVTFKHDKRKELFERCSKVVIE
jgi:hypothetical protein